jgi:hypothetical protein
MRLGGLPEGNEEFVDGATTSFVQPKFQDAGEDAFQGICAWLKNIFKEVLVQNVDWEPILCSAQSMLPHEDGVFSDCFSWRNIEAIDPEDICRSQPIGGLSLSRLVESKECWAHIPANNEEWMTVSLAVAVPSPA